MSPFYGQIYRRKDGRYAWRVRSSANEKIVATDGGQGYENRVECSDMFHNLFPNLVLEAV